MATGQHDDGITQDCATPPAGMLRGCGVTVFCEQPQLFACLLRDWLGQVIIG